MQSYDVLRGFLFVYVLSAYKNRFRKKFIMKRNMVKYFGKFLIQKSFKRIFNGPKCLMKVIHGNSGLLLSNSTKEKKH